MLASSIVSDSTRFKAGWGALIVSAALMALVHFSLIFILGEPVLFTGFAFFNTYALLVILVPFRRGEKWAWMAVWLLPTGLALPAAFDPDIMFFYFGVAAICVAGLLMTLPAFPSKR